MAAQHFQCRVDEKHTLGLNAIGLRQTEIGDIYHVANQLVSNCQRVEIQPDQVLISPWMSTILGLCDGDRVLLEKLTTDVDLNTQATIAVSIKSIKSKPPSKMVQYSFIAPSILPRAVREGKINLIKLLQRQLQGLIIPAGETKSVAAIDILGEFYLCEFQTNSVQILTLDTKIEVVEPTTQHLETKSSNIVTSCFESIAQDILKAVQWTEMQKNSQVEISNAPGGIVQGARGSGKSLLMQYMYNQAASDTPLECVLVDGILLSLENSNRFNSILTEMFAKCREKAKSGVVLLLIDDIDQMCGNSNDASTAGAFFLQLMEKLCLETNLIVFGTASSFENLPNSWYRTNRFERKLSLQPPTEEQRRDLLSFYLNGILPPSKAAEIAQRLASITGGYVPHDLIRICRTAITNASSESLSLSHFVQAKRQVHPFQLTGADVKTPALNTSWIHFGGYYNLRSRLENLIRWKFSNKDTMERMGVHSVSGILLCGPHGIGKTYLAKILAAECNANFVSIKSSELLSKYLGETESAIRTMFTRARAAAPCILFFDELDGLAQKRSFSADACDTSSGVYTRILSTLLNEMDGVENSNTGLLVLAACNRADALDPALIRPGRIDQIMTMDLPDAADREDILKVHTKATPLHRDIDLHEIGSKTVEFTASMLASICNEAAIRAIREDMDAQEVMQYHFEEAIAYRRSQQCLS